MAFRSGVSKCGLVSCGKRLAGTSSSSLCNLRIGNGVRSNTINLSNKNIKSRFVARTAGVQQQRWFSAEAAPESSEKKPCSPEVEKLVDEIVALNLLQVSELVEELNTRLNLPAMPAGGMMMPMGGAAPAAAPAGADGGDDAPAAEEEKPIVNIQLDSFDAAAKIKIIKEVKNLCGLGLKEAKAAVEGAPGVIMSDVKREEAADIIKTIEDLGGKASMV